MTVLSKDLESIAANALRLERELSNATPGKSSRPRCTPWAANNSRWCRPFGTESAALLKVVADVDPAIPVVFLDTGWLFAERWPIAIR
jgi:phosphoadenylylsulfate reductase (thioredoxin) (EC 1.8.4.8)